MRCYDGHPKREDTLRADAQSNVIPRRVKQRIYSTRFSHILRNEQTIDLARSAIAFKRFDLRMLLKCDISILTDYYIK